MTNTTKTYINQSELTEGVNVTVDFEPTVPYFINSIQEIFVKFGWLEIVISMGIFIIFFIMFTKLRITNITNMQSVLISSFVVIIFNIFMLYAGIFTSFYMLSLFSIVWLVAVITTIR